MEQPYNNLYETMDRRAIKMEAIGGDMVSRYNDLVTDNRTLMAEIQKLKSALSTVNETVETLLVAISQIAGS